MTSNSVRPYGSAEPELSALACGRKRGWKRASQANPTVVASTEDHTLEGKPAVGIFSRPVEILLHTEVSKVNLWNVPTRELCRDTPAIVLAPQQGLGWEGDDATALPKGGPRSGIHRER